MLKMKPLQFNKIPAVCHPCQSMAFTAGIKPDHIESSSRIPNYYYLCFPRLWALIPAWLHGLRGQPGFKIETGFISVARLNCLLAHPVRIEERTSPEDDLCVTLGLDPLPCNLQVTGSERRWNTQYRELHSWHFCPSDSELIVYLNIPVPNRFPMSITWKTN